MVVLFLLFFAIFGIIGVQFFAGKLRNRCYDVLPASVPCAKYAALRDGKYVMTERAIESRTSLTCGFCGWRHEHFGYERTFECHKCDLIIDRDVNNLREIHRSGCIARRIGRRSDGLNGEERRFAHSHMKATSVSWHSIVWRGLDGIESCREEFLRSNRRVSRRARARVTGNITRHTATCERG